MVTDWGSDRYGWSGKEGITSTFNITCSDDGKRYPISDGSMTSSCKDLITDRYNIITR